MQIVSQILSKIEREIKDVSERGYFWTHEVRYSYILNQIALLAGAKKLVILDIGCFPYHVGKALEEMGHTVYGIASEHEPIHNKKIAVVNIEKEKFPFKNNFFDLVLCNEVIEHLPNSPIPVLTEIFRVTKKDGLCMITTPNITRSINRVKIIIGKSIMYSTDVFFENEGKGNNIYHRHNREYTLQELSTLMEKTSWSIANKHYFISYTPFRKREKPDNIIVWLGKYINFIGMILIPSLRDTLFVLGKKS